MSEFTRFSRETFMAFRANSRSGPVEMLNLIRLHPRALYEDGREATGAEAYEAYSRISAPAFARLGGKIVWRGAFELMMVGPEPERWDIAFVARYPSSEAFAALFGEPAYREAMVHRQAGVKDSRLIRFGAAEYGKTFSGKTFSGN